MLILPYCFYRIISYSQTYLDGEREKHLTSLTYDILFSSEVQDKHFILDPK